MQLKSHTINNIKTAEIVSDEIIIKSGQDGLDLLGDMYYQGFDSIIIYEKNIIPDFFDLKTKIAGDILQKFSNYRIRLVILGDFTHYQNKSIKDFIFESNNSRHVNFPKNLPEALERLSK